MIPQSPGHPTPPAMPPVPRPPAAARRSTRRWMLVMASTAAVFFGVLVFMRYLSMPPEDALADDPLERSEQVAAVAPDPEPVPAAPAPATMPVASAGFAGPVVDVRPTAPVVKARPKKIVTATPAKTRAAASATTTAKSTAKSPAPTAATAIAKAPARRNAAASVARSPSVASASTGLTPVTLTGCLEISTDREEFRLSDTDGADAPKARSWRTGFLKKRPTPVSLVEPPDPHGLQTEVGKRVAATGVLTDREMKVSSVRVVGPSCE
jgi:hypothetical protein